MTEENANTEQRRSSRWPRAAVGSHRALGGALSAAGPLLTRAHRLVCHGRPKGAPVLSEQVFAEEVTEQTFRDRGTASMKPVEHVESLRLAGSTASDVDRPLGSAPPNQHSVYPHAIDAFIVPLAASALSVKTLLRSTLELLVTILDGIFPIVMQGARLPLFLARIIG